MVPPPAGEDVAPRQVREEQNPFFLTAGKARTLSLITLQCAAEQCSALRATVRLAVPENPVGLTLFLAVLPLRGNCGLASSAAGSARPQFPRRGSTAGYRGCQLLHIDRGASRGNPKGARKPRLVVSMREGPGRGRNPKSSPPWCRFLWYLSFGQAKERYALCAGKGRRPLRHPAERDTPGDTCPPCGARKTHRACADPRDFRPLRKLRVPFFCHRRREPAIPLAQGRWIEEADCHTGVRTGSQ